MDQRTLLRFVERILEKSPDVVSGRQRIVQLREILEEQGTDERLLALLDDEDNYAYQALRDIARTKRLDAQDFAVAQERAKRRRQEEEMMRYYGRC